MTGRERELKVECMGKDGKEVTQPPEDKKYTKKDILDAATVGDALFAYRRVMRETQPYEIADLQSAVADKAHELKDETTATQFTVLMSETRNNERFLRGVDVLADVSESLKSTGNRILEGGEEFKKGAGTVREAMEQFRADAGRVSVAGNAIADAATKIVTASHRMG